MIKKEINLEEFLSTKKGQEAIKIIENFLDFVFDFDDCNTEGNIPDCKCKKKEISTEEVLKKPHELNLGEFIVIEALSKKLIPDTLNKEEMLDAITNCIIHNPIIKLFDSCAVNLCNEEKVQSEFAKFADCYCNLMSIVLSALRQVDISKLRIK